MRVSGAPRAWAVRADWRAVINQVDTSQGQFSAKPEKKDKDPSKPADLSKDELTAVLKYGAQKMCVSTLFPFFARLPPATVTGRAAQSRFLPYN